MNARQLVIAMCFGHEDPPWLGHSVGSLVLVASGCAGTGFFRGLRGPFLILFEEHVKFYARNGRSTRFSTNHRVPCI